MAEIHPHIDSWTVLFVRTAPAGATYVASQDYYPIELAKYGSTVILFGPPSTDTERTNQAIFSEDNVVIIEAQRDEWYARLRETIKSYEPDIVHIFNNTSKIQLLYRYPFTRKTKYVLDFRSPILSKGMRAAAIRAKTVIDSLGVTSIASHSIPAARTFIGRARKKIEWLPPGAEIEKFAFKSLTSTRTDSDLIKFVYIGSLNQRRQLEGMIEAIAFARKRMDIAVDVYGTGDGLAGLQNLVAERDLQKSINFKGVVEREMIQQMLHKYDIGLCYTRRSIYDTAPPLKAVEYLACGVPVIATNTKGNAIFIEDTINGLLVGESPEAFGQGIIRLSQEPDLYYDMVQNSRDSVKRFCWAKLVSDRLIPYYKSLLGQR